MHANVCVWNMDSRSHIRCYRSYMLSCKHCLRCPPSPAAVNHRILMLIVTERHSSPQHFDHFRHGSLPLPSYNSPRSVFTPSHKCLPDSQWQTQSLFLLASWRCWGHKPAGGDLSGVEGGGGGKGRSGGWLISCSGMLKSIVTPRVWTPWERGTHEGVRKEKGRGRE